MDKMDDFLQSIDSMILEMAPRKIRSRTKLKERTKSDKAETVLPVRWATTLS